MGVHGLKPFLSSKGINEEIISIKFLSYKKIVFDAAFLLYRAKNYSDNWINVLFTTLRKLKLHNVKAIFVFDGISPIEKNIEKNNRAKKKLFLTKKVEDLYTELEIYKEKNILGCNLNRIQNKLSKNNKTITFEYLNEYIAKTARGLSINYDDNIIFKQLLDGFGFPYITSPGEAELHCVRLIAEKLVDGVVSIDTDIIAAAAYYKLPYVYTNIISGSVVRLNINLMLEILNLTNLEFLDFCILCGTDFNKRIEQIGPIKAYDLIQKHKTLEDIELKYNLKNIDYKKIRKIFCDFEPKISFFNFNKTKKELLYIIPGVSENLLKLLY